MVDENTTHGDEEGSTDAKRDDAIRTEPTSPESRSNREVSSMPPELVYWAIWTGLALIAAGLSVMGFIDKLSTVGQLTSCIGFGLVLVAFGTKASGNWRNWSIVGGGAMAVCLFVLLQVYRPTDPARYVYGHIEQTEDMLDMQVGGENNFLVGRQAQNGHWQFFAREEWLTGNNFWITAIPPAGTLPNRIIIGCLKISLLRDKVGSRDGADFALRQDSADPAAQRWVLSTTGDKPALVGEFGQKSCSVPAGVQTATFSMIENIPGFLVTSALGAESRPSTERLFSDLSSDSLSLQSQAQDYLSRLRSDDSIRHVVVGWSRTKWSEQLDTSLLVAWVAGIRQSPDMVVPIANTLSTEQLEHVVDLTGSADRTTRYNAAELLSWLLQSSSRPEHPSLGRTEAIVDAATKPFRSIAQNDLYYIDRRGLDIGNIAYNSLIALQDAKCKLHPSDLSRVNRELEQFAESGNGQLTKFSGTLQQFQKFKQISCNSGLR